MTRFKMIILAFFFAASWSTSYAQGPARKTFEKQKFVAFLELLSKQGQISPSFYQACENEVQNFSIRSCGTRNHQIMADYTNSVYSLSQLISQVNNYSLKPAIKNHPKLREQVLRISKTLQCMHATYRDFDFVCINNEYSKNCLIKGTYAYVIAKITNPKSIFLCNSYFSKATRPQRVGILLHEVSHYCETKDIEYLISQKELPIITLNESKDITHTNADSYSYWSQNGFCLPQYDCKKSFMVNLYAPPKSSP